MDTTVTCPLGATCEDARDGKLVRCRWFVLVRGQHPQTGEELDHWDCAIAWLPVLSVEMARTNRGQTAALESFRNEMVRGQDELNAIARANVNRRLTHGDSD